VRSLHKGEAIVVRNKTSTRPWQHVLEPLSGYLWLGACLTKPELSLFGDRLACAFNFGPELSSNKTVGELVDEILKHWPGRWIDKSYSYSLHEAKLLNLSTDKAFHILKWEPTWDFETCVKITIEYYRSNNKLSNIINKHIDRGENVLVHCAAGISRSATIIIHYIIRKFFENSDMRNVNSHEFLNYIINQIRTIRPINPNRGFMEQLLSAIETYKTMYI
jgi:hypothetical protein